MRIRVTIWDYQRQGLKTYISEDFPKIWIVKDEDGDYYFAGRTECDHEDVDGRAVECEEPWEHDFEGSQRVFDTAEFPSYIDNWSLKRYERLDD